MKPLFWRMFWKRFEHFAYSESYTCPIVIALQEFGIPPEKVHLYPGPVKYSKIERKKHDGFNILFYWNPGDGKNLKFKRWKYGVDIFEKIKAVYDWYRPDVKFIVVDGSQDLTDILPIVDIYIRPSRHDGAARLVRECEENGIPVFWSNRSDVKGMEVIDFIKKHLDS